MAIEVVDIANPSLVRIAKVVDVKGDELKILYDGFDSIYAYWIEDDSPSIHPLGWCLKTNHPIELFKGKHLYYIQIKSYKLNLVVKLTFGHLLILIQ